ncbi:Heptaprenylglyceryl phosphate synthase [Paraliobacillus sp. PM-2]|uniref:heptaprenylglyceryl phosphate synthase n=1 Tax=Paraliobacillus sp. PM-2 TaxID=1462524 RepID=UPI00061CCA98|nr:heptaprenylglyceryl phosphate synthase [Paraliobacillus sp. PM-2]CQR47337.1 Heptaprenylglyceryl phosphate synthase [Paraliobacillus sp. PM-2]
MYNWKEWKHVFKLDPNKEISNEKITKICESGTDAVIVGGTDDVTLDGVLQLLSQIRRYTVPCILEVSTMEAVTPGFDFYYIPMVLNSKDKKWMMDIQHQAIKDFGHMLEWEELIAQGYCIVNPEAKAFTYANCATPSEDDVIAYAQMAEHLFHLPIFYLEYSGKYGDTTLVKRVKEELSNTQLFYGGGISNKAQAKEMAEHADVIVVGNSLYDDFDQAIQTVNAVKQM